ncbi:patatin-like phospholipase family protein [Marinifilum flexuosum]|uniref:Putative patatin/cPLA2 family phospholipase n=1 Tax=Marinifilum flexuosum TaxID=1117708 RepID=A0A419X2X3_9BACT|nr:patatin family protein [Marinifilum flexuosum]RKE02094.1 putative patatin/cPLA2 family phospholipase [Marinifilum flexuosum]
MQKDSGKTALVVEGGAMRGIFAAGVLDAFMEQSFLPFDMVIGVSAGSINAAAYLANQHGRNYKVFTDYSLRPEYISWKKFLRGGHLMDLDWSWDITGRELPINADSLFKKNIDFEIGITRNSDGSSKFIQASPENLSDVMKASCSVPLFYRNFLKVDGEIVADGGVSAPIPVERAIEKGATKVMVIRSRKSDYRMKNGNENKLSRFLFRKHPGLAKAIQKRPDTYNQTIELINHPPAGVEIIDICPADSFSTKRFSQDKEILDRDYKLGKEQGIEAIERW